MITYAMHPEESSQNLCMLQIKYKEHICLNKVSMCHYVSKRQLESTQYHLIVARHIFPRRHSIEVTGYGPLCFRINTLQLFHIRHEVKATTPDESMFYCL